MNNQLFGISSVDSSTTRNQQEQTAPFKKEAAETIVLPVKDIDTDMIMPAQFLKVTTKTGLGQHVFHNLKKNDPNFPEFRGQSILVTGQNFGCGSSREHAPWGLKDAGIDVIIASDFADIFKGNAEKNGLLCITLDEKVVQQFLKSGERLSVDLEAQLVIDEESHQYPFEIPSFSKKRLLENLSDLDYLLDFKHTVQEFSKRQKMLGL
ncbi:3-isopropylmalate dehydratase small subunit [bacterium]|nr:3-isopropylmalate dehydratase small subunit [bacterium]NCQ55487.1 3-isopropylmalate dehydratase small subunit [Candidatus Parcubacteria bacterium]NCS67497.1 3-isopropylmalate dehydratase small subunit [Candidatus Peregrinibacteria bacterium]NCS96337.1 3-isopropylmalate dehydratase small subunit [bacterium]